MKQLSATDAMFYDMDKPHNPIAICVMWICEQSTAPNGVVRHKEILDYLDQRISNNPMFRRRLQKAPLNLDYPYWLEDEHFDLEYHVRHVGLPQPGDWRQLCIFTSRILSRAMDNDRAPWEIYVIEGLNNVDGVSPGSFAVLIRLHHAYVDGKSTVALLSDLMTDTPEYGDVKKRTSFIERAPTQLEMWARTIPNLVGQTAKSVKATVDAAKKGVELYTSLKGEAKPDQSRAPRTMFTAKVSPHRVYDSITWNIADLQKVRPLHPGASINDVIIAITAGGLRRYLLKHHDLPAESLTAVCPVSVRPPSAKDAGGNLVSGMIVTLGTDTDNAQQRLAMIQSRTVRGINLARDVIFDLFSAFNDLMPAYMHTLQMKLMDKLELASRFPSLNTIITNVPGPQGDKKYFAGARIVNAHPVMPLSDGIALTHAITGIGQQLTMGVTSDRSIMQDISFYIDCLQASTDEYYQAAAALEPGVASSPATRKKRKRRAKKAVAKKARKRVAKKAKKRSAKSKD